jgi:hypothetical protein
MNAGPQQRDGGLASVRCDAATALPRQGWPWCDAGIHFAARGGIHWKKRHQTVNELKTIRPDQILEGSFVCEMRSEKPTPRHQATLRSPKLGLGFSAVGLISSIDHHVCARPRIFHVTTPFSATSMELHGEDGSSMGKKKGEKMGVELAKNGRVAGRGSRCTAGKRLALHHVRPHAATQLEKRASVRVSRLSALRMEQERV